MKLGVIYLISNLLYKWYKNCCESARYLGEPRESTDRCCWSVAKDKEKSKFSPDSVW